MTVEDLAVGVALVAVGVAVSIGSVGVKGVTLNSRVKPQAISAGNLMTTY